MSLKMPLPKQNELRASNAQKGVRMTIITTIQTSAPDRLSLDELVEISAMGRSVEVEYEKLGVDFPETISQSLKSLRREIKIRAMDSIEKALREKEQKLNAMLPMEDKRKMVADEIAALRAKLTIAG